LGENTGRGISQLEYANAIGSMMLCIVQDQTYLLLWANFQDSQVIQVWIIGKKLLEFLVI